MRRSLLVARSLGVCTPPPEGAATDFTTTLDALNTGGSLVAHWPMGANLNERLGGTAITAQGTHEEDLPQLALGDVPSRAFDGSAAHGFVAPPTNAPFVTTAGTVGLLIQPDLVSSTMSLVNLSDPARTAGSFSLEIAGGGAPRVFRRKTGSPPDNLVDIVGSAGVLVAGRPYLIAATWGTDGLCLYVMDANRAPGLVIKDPETDWTNGVAAGQDIYIGRWHSEAIDHYDGLIGHLFWFSRQLSLAELETLAPMIRQVAHLPSFNAGSVQEGTSLSISMLNRGHPTSGFTLQPANPAPTKGTRTISGTSVNFLASAIPPTVAGNDTFGVVLRTAELVDSAPATITVAVTDAPVVQPPVANADGPYGPLVAGSQNNDLPVLDNDSIPVGSPRTIEITQPLAGLSIINNSTSNAKLRFNAPSPGALTTYVAKYRVDGSNSVNVTIQVNKAGATVTPFRFVTTFLTVLKNSDPSEPDLALRARKDCRFKPGFSPSNPRSMYKIDPMSGLEFFRITGLQGENVLRWTTDGGATPAGRSIDTGLNYPSILKTENNSRCQRSFNRDATLLMLPEHKGPRTGDAEAAPLCKSALLDITGTKGTGGPWRILKVGTNLVLDAEIEGRPFEVDGWLWDFNTANNPDGAYVFDHVSQAVWRWYPRTGATSHLWDVPSGYSIKGAQGSSFRGGRAQTSHNGIFCDVPIKHISSNDWGGRRLNLVTGAWGPFRVNPRADHDDTDGSGVMSSASAGPLCFFGNQRNPTTGVVHSLNHRTVDMDTGLYGAIMNDSISHNDYCLIDGKAAMFGEKGHEWDRVDLTTGVRTKDWEVGWAMNSAHISTRCVDDTWANHPPAGGSPNGGGGSTVGLRYCLCSGAGSSVGMSYVVATRLGRLDRGVIRYIMPLRSYKRGQGSEDHPAVSPDFEFVAFNSNWQEADPTQAGEHVQMYVVLILTPGVAPTTAVIEENPDADL